MKTVQRWICAACHAVHFAEVVEGRGGRCPTCGGSGEVKTCKVDDAGVVHVPPDKH